MNRLAVPLLLLLTLACRENTAPESITATAVPTSQPPVAATPPPAPPEPYIAPVEGPRLQPVDEGARDAEFAAYRAQLLEAVRRRDADGAVALIDPKIRTDFGGGGGADAFRQSLARPGTWEELETVLTHGGTFLSPEAFWAPYVYSAWPESIDAFAHFAVLGENVPMHGEDGRIIARLSHAIVKRTEKEGVVTTQDGRTGTVDPEMLRSPVGYRAGFNKVGGSWRMNAFVAGD